MSDPTRMVPIPGLSLVREDYKTNLQYYRNLKRISQAELAERSGVSLRTLQDYEQGNRDINKAQVSTVVRLADVLCVPVKDLLEEEK